MKKKLIGIGAVVLVLALLLTLAPACGNGDEEPTPGATPTPGVTPTPGATPTPTPEAKTLKIGVLAPLSGIAAPWGVPTELGVKWAADDINDAGGVMIGNDLYMIKVYSCDAGLGAGPSADCAFEMAYDHKVSFISAMATQEAIITILDENKIIDCILNTYRVDPAWPYHFNGNVDFEFWVDTWVRQAAEAHPEGKRIAIVNPIGVDGYGWQEQHYIAAEKYGLEIVADEMYDMGTQDYYPILTKVLSKNPDVISTDASVAGDVILITKQARELGFEGWIHHPTPVAIKLLKAAIPEAYLYDIATNEEDFSAPFFPDALRELNARFLEEHARPGETLNCCCIHSYSHVLFYVKACQEAGTTDPDEVLKAIEDPSFRFDRIYVEDAEVGGLETAGIKRQFPHFQCYSEIQDGELTSIKAELVATP
jgi:branched-chain amino acid transport system substrate-binding protein